MQLQIVSSSMTPIYEQIADQIRLQIKNGTLSSGEGLPSVRACARDCHISALTVKKAYDLLESEGYVKTVQGKGTFVLAVDSSLMEEEMRRQIEEAFEGVIAKAKRMKMSKDEILELVALLVDEDERGASKNT